MPEATTVDAIVMASAAQRGDVVYTRDFEDNDLLIAAQALASSLAIVTDNHRELERVEGLHVEKLAARMSCRRECVHRATRRLRQQHQRSDTLFV
jgi:DUF1680 family protein